MVITADEEAGAEYGAQWLCSEHADKVRCDFMVNEGAGEIVHFDGRRVYGVCVAEKGVFRFTLTTHGRGRARVDPADRRQRADEARAAAAGDARPPARRSSSARSPSRS